MLIMSEHVSRRRFLKLAAGGLLAIGIPSSLTAYAADVEPYAVGLTTLTLPLPHLSPRFDGMKIVQVSDLHLGEWITLDHMLAVSRQVNSLGADLIVVTGDIFGIRQRGTPAQVVRVLESFSAPEGVLAIMGNRDYWAGNALAPKTIRTAKNIQLLMNDNVAIRRQDATLYVAGLDDATQGTPDLNQTLSGIPPDSPVILLAHEPDYADTAAASGRIGLQLSGHSHGGQVRIPGKGALVLPEMAQKYDMGLYHIGGLTLYTNRGIGMSSPYVRLNCPPEITLFTLRAP